MIDIEKNAREVVRIQETTYNDKPYVDIRVWVKTFDDRGFVVTKKGITVSPEVAKGVSRAIQGLTFEAK